MQIESTQDLISQYGGGEDDLSLYSDHSILGTSPRPKSQSSPKGPGKGKSHPWIEEDLIGMNKEVDDISNHEGIKLQKTELLLKETHNLINNIPISLETKQSENYSNLLQESLKKLVKKFELVAIENENLKNSGDKLSIQHLKTRIQNLNKTNDSYKHELNNLTEDYTKVLNDNNDLKNKNDLLRTKLIKYKELYEEEKRNTKPTTNDKIQKSHIDDLLKSQGQEGQSIDNEHLLNLYNALGLVLNQQTKPSLVNADHPKKKEEGSSQSPDRKQALFEQFENILKNRKYDNGNQVEKNVNIENDALKTSIVSTSHAPPPTSSISDESTKSNRDKEVIVKCYVCCPQTADHHNHQHNQEVPANATSHLGSNIGLTCQRCHTVSSQNHDRKNSHTLDLMGEYKWSL